MVTLWSRPRTGWYNTQIWNRYVRNHLQRVWSNWHTPEAFRGRITSRSTRWDGWPRLFNRSYGWVLIRFGTPTADNLRPWLQPSWAVWGALQTGDGNTTLATHRFRQHGVEAPRRERYGLNRFPTAWYATGGLVRGPGEVPEGYANGLWAGYQRATRGRRPTDATGIGGSRQYRYYRERGLSRLYDTGSAKPTASG